MMTSTALHKLQITVNGEAQTSAPGRTLNDLIEQMNLDVRKVAIEQNLSIVPRTRYAETPINDGDRIEIVGFIGGG